MTTEWMGKYRRIIGAYIQSANRYADTFKNKAIHYKNYSLSPSEIQVIEYVLEDETKDVAMYETCNRLGVSKGAFSKIVSKLTEQGLIVRLHPQGNKKEWRLSLSDSGKQLYSYYAHEVQARCFNELFTIANDIPDEYLDKFAEVLEHTAK